MDEQEDLPPVMGQVPPASGAIPNPVRPTRKPVPGAEPDGDENGSMPGDGDGDEPVGDGGEPGTVGSFAGGDDDDDDEEDDIDEATSSVSPDAPARPARRNMPTQQAGGNMDEEEDGKARVPVDGEAILKAIRLGTADAVSAMLADRIEPLEQKVGRLFEQTGHLTKAVNNSIVAHGETLEETRELRKSIEMVGEDRELVKGVFLKLEKAFGATAATTQSQREGDDGATLVLQKALMPDPLEPKPEEKPVSNEDVFKRAIELSGKGIRVDGIAEARQLTKAHQPVSDEVRQRIRKAVELIDSGASVAIHSDESSKTSEANTEEITTA